MRQDGGVVRTPDAADKARLFRNCHMTGGRAANQRDAAVKISHLAGHTAGTEGAQRSGVGIDNRHADRGPWDQTHFAGGPCRKAMTERFPHRFHVAANFSGIVLQQVFQPNLAEIAGIPFVLMTHIGPFTHCRAQRARVVACRAPGEEIRQVKVVACIGPGVGHMLLQPQQFWRLHFR
ncbi:hypothetical protein D3C73_1086100 [compost metagenome]